MSDQIQSNESKTDEDEIVIKEGQPSSTQDDNNETSENYRSSTKLEKLWPQLRKLLVFQLKLYIDALRDLLMSPFSIVIFAIDLFQGNKGEGTLFESLMNFGRKSERAINLFNQHDVHNTDFKGIDSIISQVEDRVRREHSDGTVTTAAKESLEKSLALLKARIKNTIY